MVKLRLKELRIEKGLTQAELAEKLNISQSAIARYENGERAIDNTIIVTFTTFFDVSTDYFLGLTNIRKYSEDILAFNSTEGLTPEDLDLVHQMIENLRKKNQGK